MARLNAITGRAFTAIFGGCIVYARSSISRFSILSIKFSFDDGRIARMNSPICAVLVYVPDVPAALDWYQSAFRGAVRRSLEAFNLTYLEFNGVRLEIVPADAKLSSGSAGTVVYWSVDDFDEALRHFLRVGATLYRGPAHVEDGKQMCMLRDPWDNCIGLYG
ncbi:VOC family protein [Paraburkholderia tropica]|uniref:VOC family protein n=2 Tax=Paraburkholderia tropica TaxID=92647 RepID=UPI002AB21688|nr:VOC family protein [Paraburkholderia tropica]